MTSAELIQKLLFDSDADIRRRAAEELIIHHEDPTVTIQAFVSGLTDNDKGVRDICAMGLAQVHKDLSLQKAQAVASLITHQNIEVRNLAGDILLKFGHVAAEALYDYLQDVRGDNRKFACDIIGLSGNPHAVSHIQQLLTDTDVNVRCSAIEALGYLKADQSFDLLLTLFQNDEQTRPYVIAAIGNIGGKRSEDFLLGLLKGDDAFIRITTIDALAECANSIDIANQLLAILLDEEFEIQLILLKAIYAIAFRLNIPITLPTELREIAQQAIIDDDPEVRVAGLLALGFEYYDEDVSVLIQELKKQNPDTQEHIVSTLLTHSSPETVTVFFDKLFNAMSEVSLPLVELFGYIVNIWHQSRQENAEAVLTSIRKQFADLSGDYQKEVIELLLSISRDQLITMLSQELQSDNPQRVEDTLGYIDTYSIRELVQADL